MDRRPGHNRQAEAGSGIKPRATTESNTDAGFLAAGGNHAVDEFIRVWDVIHWGR